MAVTHHVVLGIALWTSATATSAITAEPFLSPFITTCWSMACPRFMIKKNGAEVAVVEFHRANWNNTESLFFLSVTGLMTGTNYMEEKRHLHNLCKENISTLCIRIRYEPFKKSLKDLGSSWKAICHSQHPRPSLLSQMVHSLGMCLLPCDLSPAAVLTIFHCSLFSEDGKQLSPRYGAKFFKNVITP